MIKALSAGVAEWLRNEGVIPPKNQALFSYAVYCFVFGMLPILLAFVLGLLFRMLQESLIMILPFMPGSIVLPITFRFNFGDEIGMIWL